MQNIQALERKKAELSKAEGAEGGGETRGKRRARWEGGAMDPHKHWHLCGEHQHPSLLGQGARTGCFHGVGNQRGALALVGNVGSAPAPVNALLRNSCPCSQPSFLCRAAFPVLHSHCPQLLPGCLHSQGHRGHPEGLGLPGRQREAPGTF